jgi:hypothetical protein
MGGQAKVNVETARPNDDRQSLNEKETTEATASKTRGGMEVETLF